MAVKVLGDQDGDLTLFTDFADPIEGLNEHDLRVLEFALAQRRAMSRRCTATEGQHVCALDPDHARAAATARHLCQGCSESWAA